MNLQLFFADGEEKKTPERKQTIFLSDTSHCATWKRYRHIALKIYLYMISLQIQTWNILLLLCHRLTCSIVLSYTTEVCCDYSSKQNIFFQSWVS